MNGWKHFLGIAAAFAMVGGISSPSWAESEDQSGPQTYVVGVDGGSGPPGHNFEYVDYFPRGEIGGKGHPAVVGNGSIVHFKYNLATLDGLHTATLLPTGESPAQAWANHPFVTLDEPEPAPKPMLNPASLFPSPNSCGNSASNPCTYTGASELNSGAMPAFAATDYYVQIKMGEGQLGEGQQGGDHEDGALVHYICLVHPGMQGSLTVVEGRGSSPSSFTRAASRQLKKDTAEALATETKANRALVKPNGDGTDTVTMIAGTATPFVEIAEMLPRNITIDPGDKVKWVTTTLKDPHTVTFPDTGSGPSLLEPLAPPWAPPPECEGSPDGPPPCATPEIPVNPAPNGVTAITSPSTSATSGVIATFPPSPDNFTFSFPNAGTFTYQCRIHDHMNGTVTVESR